MAQEAEVQSEEVSRISKGIEQGLLERFEYERIRKLEVQWCTLS